MPADAPGGGAADAPATTEDAATAPASGEPQPATVSDAAALLRDLASAATRAAERLDGGDTPAALAAMDAIRDSAAQGRRLLKAAQSATSYAAPARPGQLRDLVAAHLVANPGFGGVFDTGHLMKLQQVHVPPGCRGP
jgi:hypothetical protein